MAQQQGYTQGYSNSTLATHLSRTADSEAAFLLPHIKKTDLILDVGCGPGTITTGLAKYASQGKVYGIDISEVVLKKAKQLAADAGAPTEGSGSVGFEVGDVLGGLPYPDHTFDVVCTCQVLGHFLPPDIPLKALIEMRRVLKLGGVLASRDAAAQHVFPRSLDLDRLYFKNATRAIYKGAPIEEMTGAMMPSLYRQAGFDTDGGKVRVGAGNNVISTAEGRKWIAQRFIGQMQPGDPYRQSWLDAGITEEEIEQTISSLEKFVVTEDAWFASLQCEMLAWK